MNIVLSDAERQEVWIERVRSAEWTGESREPPRWTWDDTNRWYPSLLQAGVRVERAYDLRLAHAILRRSPFSAGTALATAPPGPWDELEPARIEPVLDTERYRPQAESLFDFDASQTTITDRVDERLHTLDPTAELASQEKAIANSAEPGRLRLLVAAESAGALAAAEMNHCGLPWRADLHDQILTGRLGSRPPLGQRPERMEALAERIRHALDAPATLNVDSQPSLLKAMQYAGLGVKSLSRWEIRNIDHPVIAPLLEYKKLARLASANGWHWLDTWVRDGRFHPAYVVGGVVTGRWSSVGGGALQIPHDVRAAVLADPGWKLVVADVAQVEPRVLAAMSGDENMATAGRGGDMYEGIVKAGAVASREQAKLGLLSAMYGGTTGSGAAVLPRLSKAFPKAFALVEGAARAGERGEQVSTWLGRGSPPPESRAPNPYRAPPEDANDAERERSAARARGRFTRNFVVQGTAAEWAMAWLASTRRRLWALGTDPSISGSKGAQNSDPFAGRPHLAFFVHDEVVVHTPAAFAEEVAHALREAAVEAGRLLFPGAPVEFPLSVAIVNAYSEVD
ncbi:MAG: bifunctional 3'-5' exonuclease/DNA polymerase [Promicromonosporaceae bacterium]|nr:bifunctional 3'-5' exonuclease/DNA polymerase [Promicromonosporaceae bacterium]